MMDHRRARPGRTDNKFGGASFAQLDEPLRHLSRLASIARIERRLATAGLTFIEFDFATRPAQDFDRARANTTPQLIHQAGNKKTDLYWRLSFANCRLMIAIHHESQEYSDQSAIGNRKSTILLKGDHSFNIARRVDVTG